MLTNLASVTKGELEDYALSQQVTRPSITFRHRKIAKLYGFTSLQHLNNENDRCDY